MQLFKSSSMESSKGGGGGGGGGGGHVSTNMSISDTDSQLDSFHSPLRSESPLRSDDPSPPSKALVKYVRSSDPPPPPVVLYAAHRSSAPAGKAEDSEDGGGGERKPRAVEGGIARRGKREGMVRRAEFGFRVCGAVLCLVAFSVMAADKTQGWSGDSFDRYKEYRYCVAVTVIGFAYSVFQACVLVYNLATGRRVFSYHLRYQFDFAMDQILAYLLISASSSAATRVDNWVSNWGKDEFTEMASASIGMSFLAFGAFALSSLISGYNLCNRNT